jgi:general secretion pathway protein H
MSIRRFLSASTPGWYGRAGKIAAAKRSAAIAGGFTLLEILLVLSIVAGLGAMLSFSIVGRLDSVRAQSAAREVASALRTTRAMALRLREMQLLKVNVREKTITVPTRPPIKLPETMEVKLLTATQELSSREEGSIRFYPDGGSTGGKITLSIGQRQFEVAVSWLTGEIEIIDSAKQARR